MPKQSYTMRQEADQTWSILVDETGDALRLAGISQVGLARIEAEIMLDLLMPGGTDRRADRPVTMPGVPRASRAA